MIYNIIYSVPATHRPCTMLRTSHTLKSAQQDSCQSYFIGKKTKAPTVEFLQGLRSPRSKAGVRGGAGGTFRGSSFNPGWFSHVCMSMCERIRVRES